MLKWSAPLLLVLVGAAPAPRVEPEQYAQLVIREQIMVRVQGRGARPAPSPTQWKEGKGPKCVPAKAIVGAAMMSEESVDLLMRDRTRVRARLDNSCPALDYYHGFYIRPNADGMICADRDSIRSRVGGQCGIDRFRRLEVVTRK